MEIIQDKIFEEWQPRSYISDATTFLRGEIQKLYAKRSVYRLKSGYCLHKRVQKVQSLQ